MGASISYVPSPVPNDAKELPAYLEREFRKLQGVVANLALGHIDVTYVAPPRPREGDIRLADGVKWNPVAAGAPRFVGYRNGAWALLG
jgi:hypothetical protein